MPANYKGFVMVKYHKKIFTLSVYLDDQTELSLLKAKLRSGRSKSAEALIRLRDHLDKYPDFYRSEKDVDTSE